MTEIVYGLLAGAEEYADYTSAEEKDPPPPPIGPPVGYWQPPVSH